MLYFDNAATTLQKPEEVAQAVKESFSYIGNAGRGANEASLFTSRLIFQTRKQIAELFHMEDGGTVFCGRARGVYHECDRELKYCAERIIASGRPCDHYRDGTQQCSASTL